MKKFLIILLAIAMVILNVACEEAQVPGPSAPLPTQAEVDPDATLDTAQTTPPDDLGPTAAPDPERALELAIDVSQYSNPEAPAAAMRALLSFSAEIPDARLEDFLTFHTALSDMATTDAAMREKIVDMTVEQQKENFYQIDYPEGMAEISTDMSAVYEVLKGKLSAQADKYFQIEAEFSQDALFVDGSLVQTWDYLAEYMMRYYDYLYTDESTFRRVPALRKYSQAYDVYTGAVQLDNTPSIQSGELVYDLRDSYDNFQKKYGSTPVAKDIQKLKDTWQSSNFKVNDDIEDIINTQSESVDRDIKKNYTGK